VGHQPNAGTSIRLNSSGHLNCPFTVRVEDKISKWRAFMLYSQDSSTNSNCTASLLYVCSNFRTYGSVTDLPGARDCVWFRSQCSLAQMYSQVLHYLYIADFVAWGSFDTRLAVKHRVIFKVTPERGVGLARGIVARPSEGCPWA
jgi:hypothetical protein